MNLHTLPEEGRYADRPQGKRFAELQQIEFHRLGEVVERCTLIVLTASVSRSSRRTGSGCSGGVSRFSGLGHRCGVVVIRIRCMIRNDLLSLGHNCTTYIFDEQLTCKR